MPARVLPDLLCLAYRDRQPEFLSAPRRAAAIATVCGRVRVGAGAQLAGGSVIRSDGQDIGIGDDFFLGERASVYAAHGGTPVRIGAGVTVGRNCALHSCHIDDRVVLEDGAVVLEDSQIGAGSALASACVVPAGARLAPGTLYRGNPATAVRKLEAGELPLLRARVRNAPTRPGTVDVAQSRAAVTPAQGFVALTAQVDGRLRLGPGASIWFGARIDGGHHGVSVGEGSNVQDNCTAYAMASALHIGAGVTVAQNVALQDCRIGDNVLIGMSAFVAAGTVVESDVILDAGSVTVPHQVLRGGLVWGGRPARALAPMTPERRALVARCAGEARDCVPDFQQAIADFAEIGPTLPPRVPARAGGTPAPGAGVATAGAD